MKNAVADMDRGIMTTAGATWAGTGIVAMLVGFYFNGSTYFYSIGIIGLLIGCWMLFSKKKATAGATSSKGKKK